MKILRRFEKKGLKRLFLVAGVFNFFITNIILQILLLIMPTLLATVISQLVNLLIGFYLYGKKVFKSRTLDKFIFKKYLLLALILWLLNFGFIQGFFYFGLNKNITAILITPFLVAVSYFTQKSFVFSEKN